MTTQHTFPELIDIGANLGHESFDHDLAEVIARAEAVGIVHQLVTGTTLSASQKALNLCQRFPRLSATAGIHPHEAAHADESVLAGIRALLDEPLIKAVGETGLDFNRDYSPRPIQETVFEAHLAMAADCGKPVFLHQRDAHTRFYPMLKAFRDQICGGVVHCLLIPGKRCTIIWIWTCTLASPAGFVTSAAVNTCWSWCVTFPLTACCWKPTPRICCHAPCAPSPKAGAMNRHF